MTDLKLFDFEAAAVRVLDRDGEPLFVLADVCRVLGISKYRDAAARLDEDERAAVIVDTLGGRQEMIAVNESGLSALIMTSRKPSARRFRKWVTAEVLPAIRKTGQYGGSAVSLPDFTDPVAAARAWADQAEQARKAQETALKVTRALEVTAPKAKMLDEIVESDKTFCLSDTAKILEIGPKRLMGWMQAHGWLFRRPATGALVPYRDKETTGLLQLKVFYQYTADGGERVREQALVTAKGLARLTQLVPGVCLSRRPQLPLEGLRSGAVLQ